jgi:hypothetical protein
MRHVKNILFKKIFFETMQLVLAFVAFASCEKDVSVSPPDKPPPNGFVLIDSRPRDFQIYMEEKDRRRITPDSITWLRTGKYKFTLKKTLFSDTSFTVDVEEGIKKKLFIDFTLNPAMLGSITIISNPESSLIFLNDSSTGLRTPAIVKGLLPGYYNVRIQSPNHRDKNLFVAVESSKISKVDLTLVDTTIWNDYTFENSGIPSQKLTCILSDRQKGKIYIGTGDMGLIVKQGNQFLNYNINNSGVIDRHIKNLYQPGDEIWLGSKNGIGAFNGTDFRPVIASDEVIPSRDVESMYFDNDEGMIWIGTSIGLIKGFPSLETGKYIWRLMNSNSAIKPGTFITSIIEDEQKNLWIGTKGSGILKINKTDTVFYKKSIYSTLPADNITAGAISNDKKSIFFVHDPGPANAGGVSIFEKSFKQSFLLNFPGLQTGSIYVSRDNRIWVASSLGVITLRDYSNIVILNSRNTGLELEKTTGIAENESGDIFFSTMGFGLIKLKANRLELGGDPN